MTLQDRTDSDVTSLAFFLADFAAVESGKAYVSGGFWDRIAVPEFPSAAFFSVVAVIRVPWDAYDVVHNFAITVHDADGAELAPGFDGQFQVSGALHLRVGDPTIMPVTATIPGMSFAAPGDYAFVLQIDGAEIDRWPLRVALMDPPDDAVQAGSPLEYGIPPYPAAPHQQ
ncbi:MAG: hypothetical protein WCB04_05380 [Mycobacteriales bacterium]